MKNVSLRQYNSYRNLDVDESGDLAITGPKQLFGWIVTNMDSQNIHYLKIYDKATAPTVGTDTPKITIPLFTSHTYIDEIMGGIDFSLGIGVGATTGLADADTGAPGANEIVVTLLYK